MPRQSCMQDEMPTVKGPRDLKGKAPHRRHTADLRWIRAGGAMSELAPCNRLESKTVPSTEYRVYGSPRQLERLPASVARHLPGGAVSGHIRERKNLVQPT